MPREAPDRQGDMLRSASLPTTSGGTGVVVSRSVVRKPPRKSSSGERLIDMRAAYRTAGNNGIGQLTPRNNRQRLVARAVMEMSSGSLGSIMSDNDGDEDADTINSNLSSGSISLKMSPRADYQPAETSSESPPEGSSSHSRRRSASMSRKTATRSRQPQSSRSVRSSSSSKDSTEDRDMDRSNRSERRSDRRTGGSSGYRQRSSSRKRSGRSDRPSESSSRSRSLNEKRNGRNRRTSVTKMPEPKSSGDMNRNSVTEDEIMELLSLDYELPLATESSSHQRDRSLSRESVPSSGSRRTSTSTHSESTSTRRRSRSPVTRQHSSESFSSGDSVKPNRRSSAVGESRGIDRSLGSETPRTKRRTAPRRTKSSDHAAGLDTFFKKNEPSDQRKKSSTGSRSVASMPAKSNQRLRRARTEGRRGSDRTDDTDDTTVPSSINSSLSPGHDDSFNQDRMGSSGTFHYNGIDESEGNDDFSIDLDLATARTSFQQQNLNDKLQMHLSKTDELLYSVFPKHVADSLRNGQKVEPENHDLVTIFFSDIVGFTDISSKLDPMKISDLLDRLYHSFDALSDYHDVFKVETIGDAYMAVTNLAKKQPDHCKRISEFAIDAIRVANQTLIDEEKPELGFINIRVGFHSGPVVSNVVGTRNPRYCLFGDTVNTASRMESNSEENRIHCSETSALLLRQQCPKIRIFPRGGIEVKGKGEMQTFWVHTEGSIKSSVSSKSGVIRDVKNVFKSLRGERSKRIAA